MSSRLETLFQAVQARLENILGDPNYNYTVRSVQRWKDEWSGVERLANEFRDKPVIIIQAANGSAVEVATSLMEETITFECLFLLEGSANDVDRLAALEDMKKALFVDFDGWDVGATSPTWNWRMIDPEEGMPEDGVYLTVTCNYSHDLGDPAVRSG